MTRSNKLQSLLLAELRHLITFDPSERVWQMPFAAGLRQDCRCCSAPGSTT